MKIFVLFYQPSKEKYWNFDGAYMSEEGARNAQIEILAGQYHIEEVEVQE